MASASTFAPVKVNETLTFLFDDDTTFENHHYAFHVSDAEFDAIFHRVQEAGLAYGSAPGNVDDGKLMLGWRQRRLIQKIPMAISLSL